MKEKVLNFFSKCSRVDVKKHMQPTSHQMDIPDLYRRELIHIINKMTLNDFQRLT